MNPNYLHVLFESLWTASIIPFSSEPTYYAMKAFGGYDMRLACVLAVLGATLGQSFNWLAGRFCLALKERGKIKVDEVWQARALAAFNKYGIYLLLLCWVTIGNVVVVLAGFLGAKPRVVLPLVILGEAAHYGWIFLQT